MARRKVARIASLGGFGLPARHFVRYRGKWADDREALHKTPEDAGAWALANGFHAWMIEPPPRGLVKWENARAPH